MADSYIIPVTYGWFAKWFPTINDAEKELRRQLEVSGDEVRRLLLVTLEHKLQTMLSVPEVGLGAYVRLTYDEAQGVVSQEAWERRPFRQVGDAELDRVLRMKMEDHAAALSLFSEFGDLNLVSPIRSPFETGALPDITSLLWPQRFWDEVLRLQKAAWLHRFLLNTPDRSDEIVSQGRTIGQSAFIEILWPSEFKPEWLTQSIAGTSAPGIQVLDWERRLAHKQSSFLTLWDSLTMVINEGLTRFPSIEPMRFDPSPGVRRPIPCATQTDFFGSLWRLLRLRVLNERLPVSCQICGEPVRSQRSTRMYCDRAGCRKAAQRARSRAKAAKNG